MLVDFFLIIELGVMIKKLHRLIFVAFLIQQSQMKKLDFRKFLES